MAIEDVPRVVGGAVFRDEDFHRDRGRHADPQHPPTHPTHPTHPTLAHGATFFRPRCGLNDLCDRLPPPRLRMGLPSFARVAGWGEHLVRAWRLRLCRK